MKRTAIALAAVIMLAACDEDKSATHLQGLAMPSPASPRAMLADGEAAGKVFTRAGLAYTHNLSLEMPVASIKPHYQGAIDECARIGQDCTVLNASLTVGNRSQFTSYPQASLTVRLPHVAVQGFEDKLTAVLPGEKQGDVVLTSHSTNGEDLSKQITDVEQRQAQLLDYRDRLLALSKRTDAKVDDLIKIEGELSNVQSQIETITAQKTGLHERVDTESLTIQFLSASDLESSSTPIVQAWHQAGKTLGRNAGEALTFCIAALPWLPVGIIGIFLLRLIIRRRKGGKVAKA